MFEHCTPDCTPLEGSLYKINVLYIRNRLFNITVLNLLVCLDQLDNRKLEYNMKIAGI